MLALHATSVTSNRLDVIYLYEDEDRLREKIQQQPPSDVPCTAIERSLATGEGCDFWYKDIPRSGANLLEMRMSITYARL
ncbi:hypothetical protein ACLOJK_017290 [Asimina triloba]